MTNALLLPEVQAVLDRLPDHVAAYLAYVRDPANGFVSVMLPMDDGIEYSVRV